MDCPHCSGSGLIKTPESMSIEIMRQVQFACERENIATIDIEVSHEVAAFLLNRKRAVISVLEQEDGKNITITPNLNFSNDEVNFITRNARGSVVNFEA